MRLDNSYCQNKNKRKKVKYKNIEERQSLIFRKVGSDRGLRERIISP